MTGTRPSRHRRRRPRPRRSARTARSTRSTTARRRARRRRGGSPPRRASRSSALLLPARPARRCGSWSRRWARRRPTSCPRPASVVDRRASTCSSAGCSAKYIAISVQRVLIGFAIGARARPACSARSSASRALGDILLGPTLGAHPRRALAGLGAAAHPVDEDRRGLEDHAHRDRRLLPGLHDGRGRAAARRPRTWSRSGRAFGLRGVRLFPTRAAARRAARRSSPGCGSRSPSRGCSWSPPSSSRRRWASASCSSTRGTTAAWTASCWPSSCWPCWAS